MAYPSPVHLHLLGKDGSGKSATGNSILKQDIFEKREQSKPVPVPAKTENFFKEGEALILWDWPGTTGDLATTKKIASDLKEKIKSDKQGTHLLLWVFRYGDLFDKETEEFNKALVDNIGKDVMSRIILAFTSMDNFKHDTARTGQTFEKWQEAQGGFFSRLRKDCNNRVLGFNNKSKDDEQIEKLRETLNNLLAERLNNEKSQKSWWSWLRS